MSARFGFDVDFKGLSDEELAVCRRAVVLYREIRPLVQQGDLWRLIPPRERAALSYVSPDADAAVVFGYQLRTAPARARCAWVDSRRSRRTKSPRSTSPLSARTAPPNSGAAQS